MEYLSDLINSEQGSAPEEQTAPTIPDWKYMDNRTIEWSKNGFIISVKRLKNRNTLLEYIEITVNRKGEYVDKDGGKDKDEDEGKNEDTLKDLAKSKIELIKIDEGLYNLRRYGIIFNRGDIYKIKSLIESHYYDFDQAILRDGRASERTKSVAVSALSQTKIIKK